MTNSVNVASLGSAMVADSSGNVGIGTASPSAPLQVNKSYTTYSATGNPHLILNNNSASGVTAVLDYQVNSTQTGRIRADSAGTMVYAAFGGNHQWYTGGDYSVGTERMRIDSSGNVGIGTTAVPNNTAGRGNFTVNGSSTAIIQLSVGGTTTAGAYNYFDGTNLNIASIPATGAIIFGTNAATERMRISPTAANLILAGGTTSATGTGITFPASQSASTDANCLDDYEEGSWTPAITDGYSRTYGNQVGRYIKIGKQVYVFGQIKGSTRTGTAGSYAYITLPFPANDMGAIQQPSAVFQIYNITHTNSTVAGAPQWDAPTEFRIYDFFVSSGSNYVAPANIASNFELGFFFVYTTNS